MSHSLRKSYAVDEQSLDIASLAFFIFWKESNFLKALEKSFQDNAEYKMAQISIFLTIRYFLRLTRINRAYSDLNRRSSRSE